MICQLIKPIKISEKNKRLMRRLDIKKTLKEKHHIILLKKWRIQVFFQQEIKNFYIYKGKEGSKRVNFKTSILLGEIFTMSRILLETSIKLWIKVIVKIWKLQWDSLVAVIAVIFSEVVNGAKFN